MLKVSSSQLWEQLDTFTTVFSFIRIYTCSEEFVGYESSRNI